MGDLTIKDVIPDATPLVILGSGALVANALIAAGRQSDTPMTIIEPANGRPNPAQTAQDFTRVPDPDLKLEIAPNTPQMTIGTSGPSMGGPGR